MLKGVSSRTLVVAAVLAAALAAVLGTRTFVSFDRLRVKLVKAPIAAQRGTVEVQPSLDVRSAGLAAPVAVIAELRNLAGEPQTFAIYLGGAPVCSARVPSGSSRRLDCVAQGQWTSGNGHDMRIQGQSDDWTLDYLELATHHGSSTRGLFLLVLPDVTASYTQPGLAAVALAWVLLTALLAMPAAPGWPPRLIIAHRATAVVAACLLLAVVAAPWVTPFLVLLSAGTFVKVSALVAAPQVAWLAPRIWQAVRRVAPHVRRRRQLLFAIVMAVAVMAVYGVVIRQALSEFDGQTSGLLRISQRVFDRVPLMRERPEVRPTLVLLPDDGYDAQFHYFAMFDPFMQRYARDPLRYRDVADAPPYRFGRIGFPWLARLVAGTHWERYPAVMVALVWMGAGLCALALALIAQQFGRNPAWGLLVLVIPGFWQSARMTLPEPLAAGLLLLGYWCIRSRHVAAAAALFAASLLIRETGVLLVLPIALLTSSSELSSRGRVAVLSALAPLVAWRGYVCWVLWPDWGWQGLIYSPHSLSIPFAGLMELWSTLSQGTYYPDAPYVVRAAIWYPVVLLGAAAVSLALAPRVERALGTALGLYALVAICLSYPVIWVHVGNAQRASFEMFVMLALASIRCRDYPRPLQAGLAVVWLGAGLYLLG
jgi:hypothetical protein